MTDYTLPKIWTIGEVAEYLRVDKDTILRELQNGSLYGFKIDQEWRCSDADLLAYISGTRTRVEADRLQLVKTTAHNTDWDIVDIGAFDFNWPNKGGGDNLEHYDKGYEATGVVNGQQCTFKLGFGIREAAGQPRRRVTIWLGNRAVVEFAGSNDFDNDGLLAGIIRLRSGKQLSPYQKIPDEYKGFRVERYNSIVQGPRASTNMAVVVHKDDLKSMLEHAVIRATWKELI